MGNSILTPQSSICLPQGTLEVISEPEALIHSSLLVSVTNFGNCFAKKRKAEAKMSIRKVTSKSLFSGFKNVKVGNTYCLDS